MKRYWRPAVIVLFAMTMVGPALRAQDQNPPPPPPAQSGQEQAAPPPSQIAPDQNAQAPDQNAPADQGDQNPQTQPAVARVSFIKGNVSIQRGDSGDWIAATLNTPIESGDRVSTGDGSRAEVQLDYADIIRLDQNSTAKITNLTKGQIQLQVGQGLVSYSVLANSQADAEIDTPNSAIHPLRQGEYRVEIVNDSQTQVTVRDGQAEVAEPQGSTRIESGQLITIQGTDNPQYQTSNAAGPDDFDRWSDSRDHTIANAQSWQHTDRYYTGSQDLDSYGHWENVPDYGQVWVPDQDSGWAPYREGNWDWEPYYGWTWVSSEPWGWAPYHYGRWFVYGGNWAWWPGPVGVYGGFGYYPAWSPAYVSFFGFGAGFGFGFGFGNIGWLPCGPGDFFHPWWGFGVTRVGFVGFGRFGLGGGFGRGFDPLFRGRNGFSNMGRFDNDARIRAGVSSIRGDQFGHGAGNFQRGLDAQQFHHANFMTGRLPAVPNRQSLGRVEDHVSPGIAHTASANNQHFFSQSRGSSTQRSFGQEASTQQRMIDSSHGQNGTSNSRSFAPANGGARGGQVGTGAGTGWHSFGENGGGRGQGQGNTSNRPAMQQSRDGQQGNSSRGGSNDAWHRFTPPSNSNGARQQTQPRNNNQARPNGNGNGNWHQFNQPSHNNPPRSNPSRGGSGYGNYSRGSYGGSSSRPRLDMRQPVVNQRSSGGANRSYGGNYSRSSGGGSSHGGSSSHGSSSHGGSSHGGSSHSGGHHH